MSTIRPVRESGYLEVKLLLDQVVGCVALILLFPLMLLVALVVWVTLGRPVLFRQMRPGRGCELFGCLKFRTLLEDPDGKLTDQQRLTRVGQFLRQLSLDELPQLWNIVRGELSFVGPRPLLKEYLPFYSPTEQKRHLVRPGLTGLAQIRGRNHLAFDKRLKLDVWYVEHVSWRLDLRILLSTIRVVATRQGTRNFSPPLHDQRQPYGEPNTRYNS